MKFLSLEYVKQHLRLDFDCEDSLLEMYADAAEETLAAYLNRGKTVMIGDTKTVCDQYKLTER